MAEVFRSMWNRRDDPLPAVTGLASAALFAVRVPALPQFAFEQPALLVFICAEIIERHGGRIALEAAARMGTVFIVRLPAVAAPVSTAVVSEDPGEAH
jgi:hypothetical protein